MADKAKAAAAKKDEVPQAQPVKPEIKSEFRQYLEQHPDAIPDLLRVLTKFYQDAPKECEVQQ